MSKYQPSQDRVVAPTRGINTLDQILTYMTQLFSGVKHLHPPGRSDIPVHSSHPSYPAITLSSYL